MIWVDGQPPDLVEQQGSPFWIPTTRANCLAPEHVATVFSWGADIGPAESLTYKPNLT